MTHVALFLLIIASPPLKDSLHFVIDLEERRAGSKAQPLGVRCGFLKRRSKVSWIGFEYRFVDWLISANYICLM